MFMAKRILTLLVVWGVVAFAAMAQWDVQFTDYTRLKSFYNPAVSGVDGKLNVNGAYSMQFVGYEGAPTTLYFGADLPVYFLGPRHGAGVGLMSDQIGMFKTQKISLQYAYNFKIGKGGQLALGLQGSIISEELDPTDVELEDASDPAFPTSSVKGTGFDLGAGLYFRHPKFWGGLSAQHLTSPVLEIGERHEVEISPMYYLMGGCNIKLNNPLLSLQPSFLVQTDLQSWREDVQCRLTYDYEEKKLFGGLGYSPNTSVSFLVGGDFHGVSLGYSYQLYTSGVGWKNGSHELVVSYQADLDLFKKGRNKYKSVRFL
jgi:type IX secretion system PorP/SprF family membrane protein